MKIMKIIKNNSKNVLTNVEFRDIIKSTKEKRTRRQKKKS